MTRWSGRRRRCAAFLHEDFRVTITATVELSERVLDIDVFAKLARPFSISQLPSSMCGKATHHFIDDYLIVPLFQPSIVTDFVPESLKSPDKICRRRIVAGTWPVDLSGSINRSRPPKFLIIAECPSDAVVICSRLTCLGICPNSQVRECLQQILQIRRCCFPHCTQSSAIALICPACSRLTGVSPVSCSKAWNQ